MGICGSILLKIGIEVGYGLVIIMVMIVANSDVTGVNYDVIISENESFLPVFQDFWLKTGVLVVQSC